MAAIRSLVRKSFHHSANVVRLLRAQSAFKVLFVLVFAVGMEAGLCRLFLDAFRFLDTLGGAGAMIALRLFSLFFFAMGFMLVLSGGVTSYSTIFRSEEIPFLLVRPFRHSVIVLYKYAEASMLASWAFFLVVLPFVGAYAWHRAMPMTFLLWTVLFSVPYLLLCCGLGTLTMIALVRWIPSRPWVRRGLALLTAAAFAAVLWKSRGFYDATAELQFSLNRLIPGLRLASNPLIPSWWVAEGILAFARDQPFRGSMLWCELALSWLLVSGLIEWLGGLWFYETWQRVRNGSPRSRRRPILLEGVERFLKPLVPDIRSLVMKDIRIFLRDPLQWSQTLVFFGLLALYYANLRSFHYHLLPDTWRNTIAFLNVFSVAAVMCSLGSRFIYPQLSLEGQGFWILGLSPVSMNRVMLTKFGLALAGMLVISVALMLLSSHMLDAQPLVRGVAVLLAAAISLSICGLSTGLGAIFLDLESKNPAAIVSGFGGTLNLVLSLGYMLAAIFPFGIVFHLHNLARLSEHDLWRGLAAATLWLGVLTIAATVVPLWIGSRHLARREF